jgi:Fe-S cluster assembly protein SufD
MLEVMEDKDTYLGAYAELEKELRGHGKSALLDARQAAIERFAELGFPTLDDEEWRFTNLAPLAKTSFRLAGRNANRLKRAPSAALMAGGLAQLVFVNGFYAPELSSPPAEVRFGGSLARVLATKPQSVLPHLARYAQYEEHAFTALNTALMRDGAFLHIPDNTVVETPINLLCIATTDGEPTVSHPRNLIVVGQNSQVTLVESFVGTEGEVYFTNAVTEIVAGEASVVDHYKLQQEATSAFHVATLQLQLARGSNFSSHFISLGGNLVRNEVNAVLAAEGIECTLNGLYMGSGAQHIDNHTVIDHAMPRCASHELYKGILRDRARGVFNGKIYVRQDAQKTDAKQTNQTLLLSDDATINTKPQLEIYADDVKCTHGATVGQLSDDALFYLRSRGIGADESRALLTYAFANDVIGRMKLAPVRRRLEEILLASQGLPAAARQERDE